MWAILSGIEGNIAAYKAVLADINCQGVEVEALYILGDIVAANPDSEEVIKRIQNPLPGELEPQVCVGWWEEQCFALHGLGSTAEPEELIDRSLDERSLAPFGVYYGSRSALVLVALRITRGLIALAKKPLNCFGIPYLAKPYIGYATVTLASLN